MCVRACVRACACVRVYFMSAYMCVHIYVIHGCCFRTCRLAEVNKHACMHVCLIVRIHLHISIRNTRTYHSTSRLNDTYICLSYARMQILSKHMDVCSEMLSASKDTCIHLHVYTLFKCMHDARTGAYIHKYTQLSVPIKRQSHTHLRSRHDAYVLCVYMCVYVCARMCVCVLVCACVCWKIMSSACMMSEHTQTYTHAHAVFSPIASPSHAIHLCSRHDCHGRQCQMHAGHTS
jgi:hypothetical protein